MKFIDKVVLITGASSGVGAATAVYFASLGAKLSLCGRNEQNLIIVANKCESIGKMKPLIIIADITKEEDTKRVMESTIAHYLTLNVLINNAGILETGTIETTSLEQFDKVFNTNVRSWYHLTMLAVPFLIKTEGTIINVSSVNGLRSFPGLLAYNMSKSAVDQFTKCLALELGSKKIRVNSVNPGVIITELHKRSGLDEDTYNKFLEHSKKTHPLGRPGNPEEVARTIAFLASDDASFITGVNLPVDGGRHATCLR
ncbi:3-oxoacyl-[acyl-carrier-protein] reductase FabG-like [Lycorma delicatula]|uniref:3-oxoacyl-[acyl-carrier-protein] reductase FabG-like n=1 Tax=Lycorma delicatula TaxID=130591 RepID=UPI003F518F5F